MVLRKGVVRSKLAVKVTTKVMMLASNWVWVHALVKQIGDLHFLGQDKITLMTTVG
jgi:hypothetical protein